LITNFKPLQAIESNDFIKYEKLLFTIVCKNNKLERNGWDVKQHYSHGVYYCIVSPKTHFIRHSSMPLWDREMAFPSNWQFAN